MRKLPIKRKPRVVQGDSTEHITPQKRKGKQPFSDRRVSSKKSPLVEEVLTFEVQEISSGFGFEYLKKSGWKEGEGLGKDGTGIETPISAIKRSNRACLGSPSVEPKESSCRKPKSDWYIEIQEITYDRMQEWELDMLDIATTFANRVSINPHGSSCRYNSDHIVPMRKLQDHEKRCSANPKNRKSL